MSENSPPEFSLPGFRILSSIGEGGMGVVYLAEEIALNRKVAIKIISQGSGRHPGAAARFLREARLMAHVEHPNIVRVYSFVESESSTFLVMEYVEGESLAMRLARTGSFPPAEAMKIVKQIAEALSAAWEKGIVHRDIKPSNILLDSKDRVHVADFGLAKPAVVDADTTQTRDGVVLGTPHYVAPEQVLAKDVDFRADIYSLGILFYELLTGEKPFTGKTAMEVIQKNLNDPLPEIDPNRFDYAARIQQLLEWMTGKNPGDRPQSYEALLAAIDSIGRESASTFDLSAEIKKRTIKYTGWNWIRQVISLLFIVAAVWIIMRHFLPERDAAKPPVRTQSYLAAIAPFYGPDEASAREGRVMSSLVEDAIVKRLGSEMKIAGQEKTKVAVRDHAAARELGKKLNSRIVVWGEVHSIQGETEIQPFFTIISLESKENRIDPLETDPFASFAEGTSGRVVVQNEAPDQIGLRRTTAESIGDLVTFLAGINALYVESSPEDALTLFKQASGLPQSTEYQARALIELDRAADARALLEDAINKGAADASTFALMGDLLFENGDWNRAIDAFQKAFNLSKPLKTSRAILFDGKLYFKETYRSKRFTNGRLFETPFVLAADPQSQTVIERIRIPGTVQSFIADDSKLTILYQASTDRNSTLASVVVPSELNLPLEANFGLRLQSIEAGLAPAANFMNDLNEAAKSGSVRFDSRTPEPYNDAPKDLVSLESLLKSRINRDPSQPWNLFLLAQCLSVQQRSNEASQFVESLFKNEYKASGYFEFAAMAGLFAFYGQPQWAEEAYRIALAKRKESALPIQSASSTERTFNSGFLRASLRISDQIDPQRMFEWWIRAIELSGLSPYGDDFAAAAWRDYFQDKDSARKQRSKQILNATKSHPLNIVRAAAHLDYAFSALVAFSAGFAFLIVWLLYRLIRNMIHDRTFKIADGFRFIKSAERWTYVVAFALFAVSLAAAIHLNTRLQTLLSVPVLSMDAVGNPAMVSIFEQNLSFKSNDASRFCAAVSNHLAGNKQRAAELYKSISNDDRAQKNLAALEGGKLTAPAPLSLQDVANAFHHGLDRQIPAIIMNPGRSLNIFGDENLASSSDRDSIPTLLYQLSMLFALFILVQFVFVRTVPEENQNVRTNPALWKWILPGGFVSQSPFLSYFSFVVFIFAAFVFGVQFLIPHRFPVVGIVTLILLPGYSNAISFPSVVAGQETVQQYYWSLSSAYSGSNVFSVIVLGSILALIAIQIFAGMRSREIKK